MFFSKALVESRRSKVESRKTKFCGPEIGWGLRNRKLKIEKITLVQLFIKALRFPSFQDYFL